MAQERLCGSVFKHSHITRQMSRDITLLCNSLKRVFEALTMGEDRYGVP